MVLLSYMQRIASGKVRLSSVCPDRVLGEAASSCPGNTGGSWTGLRGKFSLGEQKTDTSDHFLEVNNEGCSFCPRQGQLSNMEPTQDDVRPSAVLSPAGQRGGTAPASRLEYFLFPSLSVLNILDLMLQGLMQNCNQMHACYLFQQDKHYDLSYDTGDKALQCGRHVDIFKLWLMWRAKVR